MNQKIKELNDCKGFLSLPKIDSNIYDLISISIKNTLAELIKSRNLVVNKNNISMMETYKYLSNDDWKSLFNKKSRTLSEEYALPISLYFKKYLENYFDCKIQFSDELFLGYPCFSYRIVRPLYESDVGSLHADQWFVDMGVTPERTPEIKSQLLKFWMPINVDSNTSNLLVIPESHKHKDKYKYGLKKTNNGLKPFIKNLLNKKDIYMINNENGFPIIFNMNLIHGGALNKSKECRVSIEFEFFASI